MYNLTVRVQSLATQKALVGFKVSKIIKDVKIEVGYTDDNGEIVIDSLKEKSFDVLFEDPESKYESKTLYYYNPDKEDEVKEIKLSLSQAFEESYFKEIDAKYEDRKEILVYQDSYIEDSLNFIPASPVGGFGEFIMFLAMNITYPQECIDKNIQGKVYVSFIVQTDGTITHVKLEKGVNPAMDIEACRVVRYSPKWNPATSNGKPVRALLTKVPISFHLM